MSWWATVLVILCSVIIIMVVMILIIRFNKKIDAEASIGDKSIAVKIENDTNRNISDDKKLKQIEIDKLNSFNEVQYNCIKSYIVSMLESHILITTVFYAIEFNENITDKIFLKLLKTNGYNNNDLNIDTAIIHKFFKLYTRKIKDYVNTYIVQSKNSIDDLSKLSENIDNLCNLFENDSFVVDAIQEFKNHGFITELIDGETYSVTPDSFNNPILQKYKTKLKKNSLNVVVDLKLAKTQLLETDNKIIRVLSVLRCINLVFDAIVKHLYSIYFVSKPAVVGDSKGV